MDCEFSRGVGGFTDDIKYSSGLLRRAAITTMGNEKKKNLAPANAPTGPRSQLKKNKTKKSAKKQAKGKNRNKKADRAPPIVCQEHQLRTCTICAGSFDFNSKIFFEVKHEQDKVQSGSRVIKEERWRSEQVDGGDNSLRDDVDQDTMNGVEVAVHRQEDELMRFGGEDAAEEEEDEDMMSIEEDGGVSNARFIPQWDDQLVKNSTKIVKDWKNPPSPSTPFEVKIHYCSDCQLTWIQGRRGREAARDHPSHAASFQVYTGTKRSLVVFVDGFCTDGNRGMDVTAGSSVFFGNNSKFNVSEKVVLGATRLTIQRAELQAVIRALQIVRGQVVPERRRLIKLAHAHETENPIDHVIKFRLVVAASSTTIIASICDVLKDGALDPTGRAFTDNQQMEARDSDSLVEISKEVAELAKLGVEVVYWQVPTLANLHAKALAVDATEAE